MKYARYLALHGIREWKSNYIKYKVLKKELKKVKKAFASKSASM
jgi:SPX domain protein involved in polyphosphate accumulation